MRTVLKHLAACGVAMLAAAPALCIEYVESSVGLGVPELEGGRTELEFADINGDGRIDLLSIGDHGSPYINTAEHGVMVWFGDGAGAWSVYQNGDFGYGGLAVGDVNRDGLLDVGYAMHHNYSSTDFGDQLIEVALGDGTGMNWTPWDDGLATNGETWGMFGTDFADVDNDGDLDIGSNSFGAGAGVHVYLNEGDGTWVQSFGFIGGNSDMDFMFGDINNDGDVDFAVKHQDGTAYFGNGEGGFVNADGNLPAHSYHGTALGDVDNDGGVDLSCVSGYSGAAEVWVWDDALETWVDFSGNLPASGDYQSTQLWDMNADGFTDLAAFGNGTFTLWLGDGAGNWTQDAQFSTPPYGDCEAFRVGGDVDQNGFPDIALVADEGSWPSSRNHLRCFREASVAETLAIAPVAPRGHETFAAGSVQFIDWISAVPPGQPSSVRLEYSISGPGGPWSTIALGLPNNGRYQWVVPQVGSDDCRVRYTLSTSGGTTHAVTAAPFSIVGSGTDVAGTRDASRRILVRNHPNPFELETTISFFVPCRGHIWLGVFNVAGQRIRVLKSGVVGRGVHTIAWSGDDERGHRVGSGLYFCRLELEGEVVSRKMLLLQ